MKGSHSEGWNEAIPDYPPLPSNVGKRGRLREPDGTVHRFVVEDEIARIQMRYSDGGTAPRKTLVLQRIRFENGQSELRLGYYIIGKKPGMLGKWVGGQYATFVPEEDFKALADEARAREWY